jgi:hypothetical protein
MKNKTTKLLEEIPKEEAISIDEDCEGFNEEE